MSKHPEEPLEQEEALSDRTANDNAASQDAAARDKFLAIKSALRDQEAERQQEEMRVSVADKIRRMKDAKDNPDETYTPEETPPETPPEKPKKAKQSKKSKKAKNSGKSKKGKKSKKKAKRRGLDLFPRKGDSVFEVCRKCVFLMSSAVFMVCMFLIGQYFWDNYQNAKLLKTFEEMYDPDATEPTDETKPVIEGFEYYGLLPTVSKFLEKNPEVVGFISIPNTVVQYPVLQHKIPEEGNEYYLNKNILLQHEKAGSIFMDYRNNFDFVIDGRKQCENSDNLIIYGHNMHDYSMFGSLKKYINEANYYDQHPIVYLNSNYRKYTYKVFGMIIIDVDDETDTKFDYWNTLDFADEENFYWYVNEIKRRTVRLTDVDVKYGDQILTLSTCNSTFSEGRLVVFARLLRDGEDLMEGCTSKPNPNIKWPNSYYKWRKNTYDPDAEFIPYG